MKLQIEIGDYEDGGNVQPWFAVNITPESKGGISVRNKSSQVIKFARLMDLAETLRAATKAFYQNATTDAPINPINEASEPLT